MQFQRKEIKPTKRVCFRLKEAREKQGISLEDLSNRLRMSKKHLIALESCQFDALPFSAVYQKKLIRSYLGAIGLKPDGYVQQFVYEEMKPNISAPEPIETRARHLSMPNMPYICRLAGAGLIILLIGVYLSLQVKHIIDPPELVVFTPDQDMTTEEGMLKATGKTDKEAEILINGRQVMNNGQGFFEEEINLAEGVNTIMFTAKKKHGRETVEVRHVVYKKDRVLSALSEINHEL